MKDITDFTADTTALANLVADGLATESDNGLALRTIQTKLGVNLINTLQETNNGFQSLNKLLQLCIEKYTTNLTAMLNAETIQHEELFEIITTLQKNQVTYLELQRKIVQSPTTLFGYIGMVAGIGVTEWMNSAFGSQTMDAGMFQQTMFSDPTVDLSIAIQATLTLIIAGTLAGFFPAKKAVSISPIEALRAD